MEPTDPFSEGETGQWAGVHPAPAFGDAMPAPGELGIKEKRTWKTWQVFCAMVIAALVGALLNYKTVPSSGASGSTGGYKLPPPGGASSSTTTTGGASDSTTTTAGAANSTTTTASSSGKSGAHSSSTTTTAAGSTSQTSSTTTTTAAAQTQVLVGPMQSQGDWTSPAFTITSGSWKIGWAFQCTAAPPSGPSFEVSVATAASSTGPPAVTETGLSGNAVATESTTGQQKLLVQAPAGCVWVVKVTGS